MNLWYLIILTIFIAFKIESGKIRPNFDEIFGNESDKNESERKAIKNEQNEQNDNPTQVDQMGEEMGTDPNDQQKRELIQKLDSIKEKLKKKGKYQWENNTKIERKIAKLLGTNRDKIYKWKKEMNLNKNKNKNKSFYEEKKKEFTERFDEFKSLYGQGKQKEFVKELGISYETLIKWKKELLPKYHKEKAIYTNDDKIKMMKQYFQIKRQNSKISDEKIAKKFGIGPNTLRNWKKEFVSIL